MGDELLETYLFDDPAWEWVITGDIDGLLNYLRMYVADLKDGDEIEMRVRRHDMTQAEIDAAPEQ